MGKASQKATIVNEISHGVSCRFIVGRRHILIASGITFVDKRLELNSISTIFQRKTTCARTEYNDDPTKYSFFYELEMNKTFQHLVFDP